MQRVDRQEGYILHTRNYRETSLLLEVFTRRHGRLGLVAKGAKRPRSPWRGILLPFLPLQLGWTGRGELQTLTSAEVVGTDVVLHGQGMFCGFYLNELLVRLLHRHDAHEGLFTSYCAALDRLSGGANREAVLRIFEKRLLSELGYALVLDQDIAGKPVSADHRYRYLPERGPVAISDDDGHGILVSGSALLALAREQISDEGDLRECKNLMRTMLGMHLNGKPLHSRRLFQRVQGMVRDGAARMASDDA